MTTSPHHDVQRTVDTITQAITNKNATYAWLARVSGLRYKRLLAELKHQTRPLSLETTIAASEALELELPDLLALAA